MTLGRSRIARKGFEKTTSPVLPTLEALRDQPPTQSVPTASRSEEVRLLRRARRGDAAALNDLAALLARPVYRFGRSFCRNPEDTEDVRQEVLAAFIKGVDGVRGDASLTTWAYVVARNACLRLKRRNARAAGTSSVGKRASNEAPASNAGDPIAALYAVPDPRAGPEEARGRQALRRALEAGIAALPVRDREVLLLRDIEGLSLDEVGRVLRLGTAAVKSRLHRARARLRDHLLPCLSTESTSGPGSGSKQRGCPDTVHLASRYLEGELDGGICARLEAHVRGCTDCEERCRTLRASLDLCRRDGADRVPGDVRRRLAAGLRVGLLRSDEA